MALPAVAFTISLTVSGTTYEVLFTEGSFDAVNGNPATPLTTTPWWGNPSNLAVSLAVELRDADVGAGGSVVPDSGGYYIFAHALDTVPDPDEFSAFGYFGTTAPGGGAVFGFTDETTVANYAVPPITYYFASVAPAPVPEIDGNALAKALFILFALGLWLDLRRRRRAG